MHELDVNPETICQLIQLAREFHAQEEVVFPEIRNNPSGDWAAQTLASHVEDMTFQEFRSIIIDMEPEQQQEIVALLWLGREDYSREDWAEALQQAREDWTPKTAEYLIVHPMLAEYLAEGLEQFGYGC